MGTTPLDEGPALRRDLYLTKHNTHNRQTSMPPAGFEPTIPVSERPQTHALDRAVTGIGRELLEGESIVGPLYADSEARRTDANSHETDVEGKEFSDEKLEISKEVHDAPVGGHRGMSSTYKKLQLYVRWNGMKEDVEGFMKKCDKCKKRNLNYTQ